ncbi:MAG: hypothetical protein PHV28_10090, partial [Kiritimatiellae bacterium]|nr:hypothetical protein [Kiritimatiellia bacterium]
VLRSAFGVLVCLSVASAAFTQAAPAPRPRPPWNVAEAPCRLVVEKEQDGFFLVRVPGMVAGKPVEAVRAFASTNEVIARVVWVDPSHVTALVDARGARRGQMLRIYPVPGDKPIVPSVAATPDPSPLRGCARRTAGMDFPATLADVKTLETRCDGKAEWFTVGDFGKLGATFKEWFRGDWTRKSHLVDLQTWLRVPQDGSYIFGLAGIAPAWLLVDGRPVLEHPAGQAFDKWTSGEGVPLKAGLRQVRVRTVCRQEIDTGLAWKRAGEPGVATNVAMVTGGDLREGRWEWQGQRLHPYATAKSGRVYRFEGKDDLFVPFVFEDGTSCWGTNHVAVWQAGNRVVGEGKSLSLTLATSTLPAPLRLRAQAATGEKAEYETLLSYDGPVWSQYGVTTRVTGVPAVCYADDRVHPIIRVRTSAADGLAYELNTGVEWAAGGCSNLTHAVVTDKGWARVYLCEAEAGSVARVTWSLRHCGVELDRGAVRFLREPYGVLPDTVSGETLKAGGEFVVLVASKASRGEPAVPAARPSATNGVVLLDGFIYGGTPNAGRRTPNAQQETGNLKPETLNHGNLFRVVDVQAIEQSEAASGMSLLLPFAAVREVLPAGVVAYAPSLLGISREGGTAGFERRLSAMTGLLSGPACGNPRVLLVAPPAFDVLPGCGCVAGDAPCVHAAEARAYAEAVIRVADAHGVETVDLFTAFQTSGSGVPLVRNGALTGAGIAYAEQVIAKKILAR